MNKEQAPPVFKVVLTGGPCSGKTTSLAAVSERFQALGYKVWKVPEAANILISGGTLFYGMTKQQQYNFQITLLRLMLNLENSFIALAKASNVKSIVLCDRGAMDPKAYMPEDEWHQMLAEMGVSEMSLRDDRYNCVIHLVTAAEGAEEFYSIEGHASRSEPPEMARDLDHKTKSCWVGFPYFSVIDNSTSFNEKIGRVIKQISRFLGLGETVGDHKRKFLISNEVGLSMLKAAGLEHLMTSFKEQKSSESLQQQPSTQGESDSPTPISPSSSQSSLASSYQLPFTFPKNVKVQEFEVEHDYVLSEDTNQQIRLRKRGQRDQFSYSLTTRTYTNPASSSSSSSSSSSQKPQKIEKKRIISRREYQSWMIHKDPRCETVKKTRYSFVWENQYFELDVFLEPHPGLMMLEFYTEEHSEPKLPPFLPVLCEVTSQKPFSMFTLALKSEFHGKDPEKLTAFLQSLSQSKDQTSNLGFLSARPTRKSFSGAETSSSLSSTLAVPISASSSVPSSPAFSSTSSVLSTSVASFQLNDQH